MMRFLLGIPLLMAILVPDWQMTTFAENKLLPVVTDPAFIAKIQFVIQDKGIHNFAIEKFDETKNKSSMTIITGDKAAMFIFDYEDQVVYSVDYSVSTNKATSCVVVAMDQAEKKSIGLKDNFHFFGGWRPKGSKTIPHMFSTKQIFSLNNKSPIVYKGTKTIDGIQADYWTTSMHWADDKDFFQVYYYFTPSAWAPAESDSKTNVYPLRIEIMGSKSFDNGTVKSIHHFYEYLDFVTSKRLPEDAFDIPEGAYCSAVGKVTMKSLPTIPDAITYSREIVDKQGNVNFADVIYDKKMGAMEIVMRADRGVVLYDFKSGVRYQMKGPKCTARAIDPAKDANSQEDGDYVKDIGPAEFYLLNRTYVDLGRGFTRSIDGYQYGGDIDNTQFDVYFGRKDWKFPSNSYQPPLTMDRDGKHYNFFNFKASATSLRTSGMWGACKSYRDVTMVKMVWFSQRYYSGRNNILSDANIALLSDAIAKNSWLENSQVQILLRPSYYDDDTRRLTLYIRLLAPPSPEYMYKQGKNFKVIGSQNFKTQTLAKGDYPSVIKKSAGICETTASSTKFLCRNYDLCKNGDGSFEMRMYTAQHGGSIGQSTSCDHFSRSVDSNAVVSVKNAMSNLQDAVKKGFLTVSITTGYYATFTAIALDPLGYKNIKYDKSSSMSKFQMVAFPQTLKKTETIKSKTSEDCARQCLSKGHYHCKAFKMCYGTNQCVLTNVTVVEKKGKGNPNFDYSCVVYNRNYIADFKAMPGLVMQYNSKDIYQNVQQPNDCAAKCSEKKDYKCESFNFCADTKECLLSKTHVYSVPADQIKNKTTACTHYSKNYLLDFDRSANTALSSDDKHSLETIAVSSPEKCAYLCQTGYSGKGCVQFDYCSDKNLCQIANSKMRSYVAHVPNANCDTFTITDVQKLAASGKLTSNDTTYTNGAYGGLAFAMILVGLAFGAGILFVLRRKGVLSRFTG